MRWGRKKVGKSRLRAIRSAAQIEYECKLFLWTDWYNV